MENKHYAIANDGILDVGMVVFYPAAGSNFLIINKKLNVKEMCITYDLMDYEKTDLTKDEYPGFEGVKAGEISFSEKYNKRSGSAFSREVSKGLRDSLV